MRMETYDRRIMSNYLLGFEVHRKITKAFFMRSTHSPGHYAGTEASFSMHAENHLTKACQEPRALPPPTF